MTWSPFVDMVIVEEVKVEHVVMVMSQFISGRWAFVASVDIDI